MPEQHQGLRLQDVDAVRAAVGDEHAVRLRHVQDSLRLAEAGEAALALARARLEHFQRVVAERGDEEAMPLRVHAEMVDSALHTGHGDVGRVLRQRSLRRRKSRAQEEAEQK